jgi:hypothetical protein
MFILERFFMAEFEVPATAPVDDTPAPETLTPVNTTGPDAPVASQEVLPADTPPEVPSTAVLPVNPVRAAAGRLGAKRRQELISLGKQYEQEHSLTPGRQRLKQLIQLGKRYELEHGLRSTKPRRKRKGDAWSEFLAALTRVVKPAYRPAVEELVAVLSARSVMTKESKTAA